MTGRLLRATDWWINRPSSDFIAVIAAALGGSIIDPTQTPSSIDHSGFYQTATALSATLLSLSTLVVTLLFTVAPNDRLDRVIDSIGQAFRALITHSLTGLVITTGGFAALFIVEASAPGRPLQATIAGLTVLMLARFARVWWLLGKVLEILMVRDSSERESPSTWRKPRIRSTNYAIPMRPSKDDE